MGLCGGVEENEDGEQIFWRFTTPLPDESRGDMPPRRRRGDASAKCDPMAADVAPYDVAPDGRILRQYSEDGRASPALTPRSPSAIITRALRAALLPAGYPDSVTRDYASFQAWDSIQGLCSYVRGVPSSAAVLAGLGLGRAASAATTTSRSGGWWRPWARTAALPPPLPQATPLSAITTFFYRDLAAMAAGMALASVASLDAHAKQWRLAADGAASLALALDLAAGAAGPAWFGPLVTGAGIARALCGVAGGATRAALTHHFSRGRCAGGGGNAADVAAKEGTQEAAVTLVGMALGLGLARLGQAGWPRAAAAVWVVLTALHLCANVRAVRALRLTSVNRARADVVLDAWLAGGEQARRRRRRPLSPEAANAAESLLPPPLAAVGGWVGLTRRAPVRLGVPLGEVAALAGVSPADLVAGRVGGRAAVDEGGAFWAATTTTPIAAAATAAVALDARATPSDTLRAYAVGRALAAGVSPPAALASAASLVDGMRDGGWETGLVALGGVGVRVVCSGGGGVGEGVGG